MRLFLFLMLTLCTSTVCFSQNVKKVRFRIAKDKLVVLRDTSFITKKDTAIFLTKKELKKVKVKESPYIKSARFYDTLRSRAGEGNVARDFVDLISKKEGKR